MGIGIIIVVWAALMLSIITTYNSLVNKRNQVNNANGAINAMLEKRYALLPNLVSIVKEHMAHEKEILSDISSLMEKSVLVDTSAGAKNDIDNQLRIKMGKILSGASNDPGLKSDTQFLHLQGSWNEAEEQISAARRAYNEAVTEYNSAIEGFPGNMFAKNMKLEHMEVFDIPQEEKENVDASKLFASHTL